MRDGRRRKQGEGCSKCFVVQLASSTKANWDRRFKGSDDYLRIKVSYGGGWCAGLRLISLFYSLRSTFRRPSRPSSMQTSLLRGKIAVFSSHREAVSVTL